MMTTPRRPHLRCTALFLGLLVLAFGACRDELVQPTQGTLVVDFGTWTDVEVFVDDQFRGVDVRELRLPDGTYRVRVERDCFDAQPTELVVPVEVAREVVASFRLEPRPDEVGTVRLSATHELTGEEIAGAAVLRETSPGVFTSTGQTTPAVITNVPCGTARFRVGGVLYEEITPAIRVPPGSDTQVDLTLGPLRAVLAEMFTYIGCPNCPPAADTLASLNTQLPGEVYVIEWHARPGLPLYDETWRERQQYYTQGANIGFPHAIFQGVPPLIIDGDLDQRLRYKARVDEVLAECGSDCALAIESEAVFGAEVEITVWLKHRSGALPGDLRLRFVVVEGDIDYGSVPPFHFVPRGYEEQNVSLVQGEVAGFAATISIDPSWDANHLDYVVYVQSEASGDVLAVDGSH